MKYKALFLLIPLLSASLVLADTKQNAQSAVMLAQYPQTEAFKDASRPLIVGKSPQHLIEGVCFLAGSSGIRLRCDVGVKGQVYTVRDVYSWAFQAERRSQLSSGQLAELKKILRQMPPNAAKPTLKNLLIIKFIEANKPATRIYDRSKLPPQIVKLYQLVGASKIASSSVQTSKN